MTLFTLSNPLASCLELAAGIVLPYFIWLVDGSFRQGTLNPHRALTSVRSLFCTDS